MSSMPTSTETISPGHWRSPARLPALKPFSTKLSLALDRSPMQLHRAVMIGQHQAVGRDERAGAAAFQARDRALQAPEPGVVDVDAVLLLHRRFREIVERPHAFVRDGGGGKAERAAAGRSASWARSCARKVENANVRLRRSRSGDLTLLFLRSVGRRQQQQSRAFGRDQHAVAGFVQSVRHLIGHLHAPRRAAARAAAAFRCPRT